MKDPRSTVFALTWRFVLVLVPAILVLGLLNALPQFLGGDPLTVVRYRSVEEAEARLGVRLYRPLSVPGAWVWPPTLVRFAAAGPGWVEFRLEDARGENGASFNICQTIGRPSSGPGQPPGGDWSAAERADTPVPTSLLPPGQLLQESDVVSGGRPIHVQRLLLDDGRIVHELWWRAGPRRVMLRGRMPADSLLRLVPALMGTR